MITTINNERNFYTVEGNIILYCLDKAVGNKRFYAIIFESSLAHHFEYCLN